MKTFVSSLLAVGCLFCMLETALAVDVFVVDAKGVELAAGQVIDGGKPLSLAIGQKVTLVTADGRTIKLKGPSNAPPVGESQVNTGDVVESLQGLMRTRKADTSSAGIIRAGDIAFTQPAPWLVEVRHSGDRCVLDGEKIVLWRSDESLKGGHLEIGPADKSWSAHAAWPQGSDKLAVPTTLQLHDGQTYVIAIDQSPVNLAIHVIPKIVKSDAARAAWMIELGCEPQAKALIAAMR